MQKVNLSAALEFAQHSFADHAIALAAHKSLDGQAPLRRGRNHAQVAQTFQSHAQGARNRRGGEREHIDLGAKGLHGLFVTHAKAVFLVNDEQPQALELHVLAEQLVRADDDVDGAVSHTLDGGGDLLGRAKAAHLGHLDRPFGKAVHQRLVVLLGQQRGGRQQRHLLAAGDRNEGRTQRDLGFAKADVAADQPVHGPRADHVLNDGMDGGALIGGFFKAEVVGKAFVVVGRIAEGVAFAGCAARINVEQFGGRVADLFGGAAFGFFPLAAAQAVQRCFIGTDAGVAADLVQLADRHVERSFVGVLQVQELAGALTQVHVDQTLVAPDAVRAVHHRVAHFELAQVFDQRFNIADLLLLFVAPADGDAGGEQLGLGDEVDIFFRPAEAFGQRGGGNAQFGVAGLKVFQRVKGWRRHIAGAQKVEQAFTPAIAFGQDQHAVRSGGNVLLEFGQRVFGAAHHGHVTELLNVGAVCTVLRAGAQRQLRIVVGPAVKLFNA